MITYDKDEKIRYIARRHGTAFLIEIIFLVIIAIMPYFFYRSHFLFSFSVDIKNSAFFLATALYSLWLLFLWLLFFIAWSDYYLDIWIITDGRVIDVEQHGVFKRQINTYRLDKITNLIIPEKTWLGKLFKFGSIHVMIEGDSRRFVISEIAEPERVKELIKAEQNDVLERLKRNVEILPNH